ncbi:MAG: hypothetical protein HQK83_16235 [Fibrobacteria bacterium]|nr:hypothetical protein [Fibrobacteria bacterium]
MGKKTAVIIKDKERQYEGLRCSLGLLLEDHQVSMIVLNHEINPTEEYTDNMGFIDEMGGHRFSNEETNISKHGFTSLHLTSLQDMLKDFDAIIPF